MCKSISFVVVRNTIVAYHIDWEDVHGISVDKSDWSRRKYNQKGRGGLCERWSASKQACVLSSKPREAHILLEEKRTSTAWIKFRAKRVSDEVVGYNLLRQIVKIASSRETWNNKTVIRLKDLLEAFYVCKKFIHSVPADMPLFINRFIVIMWMHISDTVRFHRIQYMFERNSMKKLFRLKPRQKFKCLKMRVSC